MKRLSISRFGALALSMLAVAGCGSVIPSGGSSQGSARVSHDRHGYSVAPALPRSTSSRVASAPRSIAPRAQDAACLSELGAAGTRFDLLPDNYAGPGCNQLGTVQLATLAGDNRQFAVSNIGPVQCQVASNFTNWARFGVDRAARQILGSPLARIETMGSYACRNIAGSDRRSAHSTAEAIDVSAFVLADGRRISLSEDWRGGSAAEREFLRVVHRSACKRFGTVLGPDYNRAHEDHFHLEGSGPSFCR